MSKADLRNWNALLSRLREQYAVRVGIVGDGAKAARGGLTQAELGAVHEYGAPAHGIPRRSFIGDGVEEFRQASIKQYQTVAKAIISGKITAEQGLEALGAWAAAQLKNRIVRGLEPANSEAVLARKKRIGDSQSRNKKSQGKAPRPLIDTGSLLNSITHAVVRRSK